MKRRKNVWVVIHCEWMQFARDIIIDEMVFHVRSSRKVAEHYMLSTWVASYSWWKLERHVTDEFSDDALETHYYSHKGKAVTLPAYKRAMNYFKKARREGLVGPNFGKKKTEAKVSKGAP